MAQSPIFKLLVFSFLLFGESSLAVKIEILHFNDINSQLQSIKKGFDPDYESIPTPCDSTSPDECEGGIANLIYHMNNSPPEADVTRTIRISTGNLVGGENGWLSVNRWDGFGKLVGKYYSKNDSANFIQTFGFKEFEAGLDRTLEYFHANSTKKIVLANVNCNNNSGEYGDAELEFCKIREQVQNFAGIGTVGVVGFINPYVDALSSPGLLKFDQIVPVLKRIADSTSYKSLIAIGDGSLDTAKQILESVPKVKLVIYGRGFGPTRNMSGEAFPMPYRNGWIATAGRYGTSFGKLVVDIADSGEIREVTGKLVNTNHVEAEQTKITEVTDFFRKVVEEDKYLGKSVFKLEGGTRCWRDECNLGNLVADAMVHCAYKNRENTTIDKPIVGIWHGGALFKDSVMGGNNISGMDVHRWLPYHNRVHLVKVTGDVLWKVFGLSGSGITASQNSAVKDWGQFLQVSNGLEVWYKTDGVDVKVDRIRILDESEGKPVMRDIVTNAEYDVVIPSFIKEGRNVYDLVKSGWKQARDIGFDDVCLKNYIESLKMITVGFEERIYIDDPIERCDSTKKKGGNTALTVFLTILFMCVIVGIAYVGYRYVWPKLTGRPPGEAQNFRNF